MISPTSITDRYIIQPTLIARHRRTLDWLSAAVLWNKELAFLQKLLDQYAPKFATPEEKKAIGRFQSLITYYKHELIINLCAKLRQHEKKIADMLGTIDETKVDYFKEHDSLMQELESANNQLSEYKEEIYSFVEKVM